MSNENDNPVKEPKQFTPVNQSNEKLYTRPQLIEAMQKFNKAALTDPEGFAPFDGTKESAVAKVDYLLNLVE